MKPGNRGQAGRALGLLARLEKQALDLERIELTRLDAEMARGGEEWRRIRAAFAAELELAWGLPGGPGPFGPYAERARARARELEAGLERLARTRARAEMGLLDRACRFKALDATAERLRALEAERLAQRIEAARQEAALLRAMRTAGAREEPGA